MAMADERGKAIDLAFAQIENSLARAPSCGWGRRKSSHCRDSTGAHFFRRGLWVWEAFHAGGSLKSS